MFVYQTLPDSEILLIHYENEGYEVRFHAMSVRDSLSFSFTQNKIPTTSERALLFEWVGPLFHEQFVLKILLKIRLEMSPNLVTDYEDYF